MISFLMNLLMIEVRAERAFDFYEQVISSPQTFTDRPREAAHAVELINRIRQDESVHVAWLRAAISEFRSFTIKTTANTQVSGASILDPVWEAMVHWHSVEMHEAQRPADMALMQQTLLALDNGQTLYETFKSMAA